MRRGEIYFEVAITILNTFLYSFKIPDALKALKVLLL